MPAPLETQSPPTSSSGTLAAWGIVVVVVATVLVGLIAAPRIAAPSRPVSEDAACLEWTDGCRVCRRLPEGSACSLPGIACQPAEPRCLTHAGG